MCQAANRPSLTLVTVYFRNGRTRTLPFRSLRSADAGACHCQPARRFLGWLKRMRMVQPAFPTMIRSIYMRVYDQPCDACRTALLRALGRYRLADRFRYQATPPAHGAGCGCGCRRQAPDRPLRLSLTFAKDDWFGQALLTQSAEVGLSIREKASIRHQARRQKQESNLPARKRHQLDHAIPLAQVHLEPTLRQHPNQQNLRLLTRRVHREKEKMWKRYVYTTFFRRCTTADERKRKLGDIFTELRKKYPNDTISRLYGREMELLEID